MLATQMLLDLETTTGSATSGAASQTEIAQNPRISEQI
jgi:hypothetical protein